MSTQDIIIRPARPRWMSEDQILEQFVVGSLRLAEFSARGDLACTVNSRGEVFYDAGAIEGIFRRRGAAMSNPDEHFGKLGKMSLGPANEQSRTVIKPRSRVSYLSDRRTAAA